MIRVDFLGGCRAAMTREWIVMYRLCWVAYASNRNDDIASYGRYMTMASSVVLSVCTCSGAPCMVFYGLYGQCGGFNRVEVRERVRGAYDSEVIYFCIRHPRRTGVSWYRRTPTRLESS